MILQLLNILAFVVGLGFNAVPWAGTNIGDISAKYPVSITPAGYAFLVWGLIYFALGVFLVWQVLPRNRENKVVKKDINVIFIVAMAFQSAWVPAFCYEKLLLSSIFMLGIYISLLVLYVRLNLSKNATKLLRTPFSFWFSWISVANLINITITLKYQFGSTTFASEQWSEIVIIAASLIASLFTLGLIDLPYGGVAIWALIGIFIANYSQSINLVAIVCIVFVCAAFMWALFRMTLLFFSPKEEKSPTPFEFI